MFGSPERGKEAGSVHEGDRAQERGVGEDRDSEHGGEFRLLSLSVRNRDLYFGECAARAKSVHAFISFRGNERIHTVNG